MPSAAAWGGVRTGANAVTPVAERSVADAVAPEVLNLRHALDQVTGAVFPDTVHPNERGAELVGQELYRAIRPRLLELAR